MEELKSLVKKLETEYNEEEQIKILQDIGKKLLTEYVIETDQEIIEPLRVEAYYYPYKTPEKFNDPCAHPSSLKIGKFDRLYFIEEKYGYPGVDLCLSLGDYYLSFLIKNSRVTSKDSPNDSKLYLQMDLYDKLQKRWQELQKLPVLKRVENNHKTVFVTSRVGINEKNVFAKKLLASVTELTNSYTFEKGYAKMWTVANYLVENGIEETDDNIRKLLGSRSNEVKKYCQQIREEKTKMHNHS